MAIEKIISIAICIVIIVVVAAGCSRNPNDLPPTTPKHKTLDDINVLEFRFSIAGGTMKYSGYDYTAKASGDKTLITIRPNNEPIENTVEFEADLTIMEKLYTIIADNDLLAWNGFDKRSKNVLDGKSFSMAFTLSDGRKSHAYGYQSLPKNFRSAKEAIEKLFMQAYAEFAPSSKETDT